jgi:uncharacterized protein
LDDAALFECSKPVFEHYLGRIDHLLGKLDLTGQHGLTRSLQRDAFTAGEHFRTAQGFVLRTLFPLIGKPIPEIAESGTDLPALLHRGNAIRALIAPVRPDDFIGASNRIIEHRAGDAELEHSATDFLTLYAMPNFFFHLTSAYAILRQTGMMIGKGDFDGWHSYPAGFSFKPASEGT